MTEAPAPDDQTRRAIASTVAIGVVALAVAMGIGRFAFTPLLPLMMRDGTLDAIVGAEWAAANYGGYLLGALSAARWIRNPLRGLRIALVGVVLSTLLVAWIDDRIGGAVLRAIAGVCSAWALIGASSWCLAELATRQAAGRAAWIYAGVGLGIGAAGAVAWVGGPLPARWLWLALGLLAAIGAAYVLLGLRRPSGTLAKDGARAVAGATQPAGIGGEVAPQRPAASQAALIASYGCFGFGYIVPATFLPAMARQQVADPWLFGMAWPLFGLAAALSVAFAARWLSAWPRLQIWALAQAIMALGTALPVLSQALWALALSAVCVGSTLTVVTMAALQLARERQPDNPTLLLARMTSAFALGQIAGPLLVRALGHHTPLGWDAMAWASAAATLLLACTAAYLWRCRI